MRQWRNHDNRCSRPIRRGFQCHRWQTGEQDRGPSCCRPLARCRRPRPCFHVRPPVVLCSYSVRCRKSPSHPKRGTVLVLPSPYHLISASRLEFTSRACSNVLQPISATGYGDVSLNTSTSALLVPSNGNDGAAPYLICCHSLSYCSMKQNFSPWPRQESCSPTRYH